MENPIPEEVKDWIAANGFGTVVSARQVGGGCINDGMVLRTGNNSSFFLKTNRHAPPEMFEREAEGLAALAVPGGPRVPGVCLAGAHFLLLEDLSPVAHRVGYWTDFGRQLAALHSHSHPGFGFHHDNYIGSTPQPNPWTNTGYDFFANQRLLFQAGLAERRGLLSPDMMRKVERIAARLPELIPDQPASLIHGDLWSGNAITDADGQPAIIDPAAHYGWAEAELAMTALFGAFPEVFYRSYEEARPLHPGYRARFPIYNLYHLLNHVNLFGSSYLGEVQGILRRFT